MIIVVLYDCGLLLTFAMFKIAILLSKILINFFLLNIAGILKAICYIIAQNESNLIVSGKVFLLCIFVIKRKQFCENGNKGGIS